MVQKIALNYSRDFIPLLEKHSLLSLPFPIISPKMNSLKGK